MAAIEQEIGGAMKLVLLGILLLISSLTLATEHKGFSAVDKCVVFYVEKTNPVASQFLGGAASASSGSRFSEIVKYCKELMLENKCRFDTGFIEGVRC